MNRLKFLRFLFVLFIVLTAVFGIGLIVSEIIKSRFSAIYITKKKTRSV